MKCAQQDYLKQTYVYSIHTNPLRIQKESFSFSDKGQRETDVKQVWDATAIKTAQQSSHWAFLTLTVTLCAVTLIQNSWAVFFHTLQQDH